MPETETLRLSLPLIIANQAQKHLTLNECLERLDLLIQAQVISRTLSFEPASPAEGDTYIRPATATGAHWAGFSAYCLMRFASGAWEAIPAPEGVIAYVADEAGFVVRTTADWIRLEARIHSLDELNHLGINATADSDNVLSLKGPAALISAQYISDGGSGDVSLVLNKESSWGTAQILWQTAFGSQMILGLLGSNDLSLKSSTDGVRFVESLRFDHRSGRAHFMVPPYRRPNRHQAGFVASQSWLASSSAADNNWQAICYAPEPGLFVAVAGSGSGNRVMTSPDAVVWTARTSAADNDWQALAYAPEVKRLVAVASSGTGNRVMTSDDGINWTLRATPADLDWRAVAFAPEIGLFAAVASSGTGNRVMTSPDGITWSLGTSAADQAWKGLTYAAETGLFCAVASTGTGNRVMTSRSALAAPYRS